MIKMIKRELLPVIVVLVFMGAYIGAAQASMYYYESLPGLVNAPAAVPFDSNDPANSGDVIITINDSIIFNPGEEVKTIDFTVSASGSIDINDVEIKLSLANDNIISDAILINGDRRIEISRLLADNLDIGETDISLLAVVDNRTEINQPIWITATSTCSAPIDAGGYVIYCDEDDNYLLSSAEDLLHISNYQEDAVVGPVILAGDYKLIDDISFDVDFTVNKTYDADDFLLDMTSTLNYNNVDWNNDGSVTIDDNAGWKPLGGVAIAFTGGFYGNGYSISNLYINRPAETLIGFIGYINGGVINNLTVDNASITGNESYGGIVGAAYTTNIVNCSSSGALMGGSYAGGIVGWYKGIIEDSNSSADIFSISRWAGGLVGYIDGSIYNSYAEGYVNAIGLAGGLVGAAHDKELIIMNSYAAGNVFLSNSGTIGGLVGVASYSSNSYISRSYATGNVSGINSVINAGGLVGSFKGDIDNCYATGDVVARNRAGGLAATLTGNLNNSYATGYVNPSDYAHNLHGSLIRELIGGTITKSYSINPEMNALGESEPHTLAGEYCAVGLDIGCVATDINENWEDSIWNGLGTATPTLKNMPN